MGAREVAECDALPGHDGIAGLDSRDFAANARNNGAGVESESMLGQLT
jgi:hypothetical protein